MKKIVALFLITSACYAQNQNSIWCFGDSAGIDFNNSSTISFASGMRGRGGCTSVADSSGYLLFYSFTNATTNYSTRVFSNQHQIMQGGDTIVGETWYNDMVSIPKPNSNNLY